MGCQGDICLCHKIIRVHYCHLLRFYLALTTRIRPKTTTTTNRSIHVPFLPAVV
jgi:hypothetical protein